MKTNLTLTLTLTPTSIHDAFILEPKVFDDERGFLFEGYNRQSFYDVGINEEFIQDNHSHSIKGVLRGLHYQLAHPQGKLVRVLSGTIFDVALDLRRDSPTFRHSITIELSAEKPQMLWLPAGLAHGFLVLSPFADVLYKVTDYYDPGSAYSIAWNDPDLAIPWPLARVLPGSSTFPLLSRNDANGLSLKEALATL